MKKGGNGEVGKGRGKRGEDARREYRERQLEFEGIWGRLSGNLVHYKLSGFYKSDT